MTTICSVAVILPDERCALARLVLHMHGRSVYLFRKKQTFYMQSTAYAHSQRQSGSADDRKRRRRRDNAEKRRKLRRWSGPGLKKPWK